MSAEMEESRSSSVGSSRSLAISAKSKIPIPSLMAQLSVSVAFPCSTIASQVRNILCAMLGRLVLNFDL